MNHRFIPSSKYPGYSYTMTGEFWRNDPATKIVPDLIDDRLVFRVEIAQTIQYIDPDKYFAYEYFGTIDGLGIQIGHLDGDPLNFNSQNLWFDIPLSIIAIASSKYCKVFRIGTQLFKRMRNFPKYFISDRGLIYSTVWKKIKILNTDKDGYKFAKLTNSVGVKTVCRINRAVYEEFVGPIPAHYTVDHYDGNIANNDVVNLSAIHTADNTLKGHCHDMRPKGEIPDSLIHLICKSINSGMSLVEIFANPEVGPIFENLQKFTNYTLGLVRGLYRREITSQYDLRNFTFGREVSRKYLPSQIEDVCKMLEKGIPKSVVSTTLGIPMNVIKSIYGRYTWKEISSKYNLKWVW